MCLAFSEETGEGPWKPFTRPVLSPRRRPWNKGKLTGPKPPLQPKQVWAIRTRLQLAGRTRDLALFNLAIDSKLRECDLVSVKVENVAPHGYAIEPRDHSAEQDRSPVIRDRRTDAPSDRRAPCGDPEASRRFPVPWPRRQRPLHAPIRPPAVRLARQHRPRPVLVRHHSLRRTKATLIYRRTGTSARFSCSLGTPRWRAQSDTLDAIAIAEAGRRLNSGAERSRSARPARAFVARLRKCPAPWSPQLC